MILNGGAMGVQKVFGIPVGLLVFNNQESCDKDEVKERERDRKGERKRETERNRISTDRGL